MLFMDADLMTAEVQSHSESSDLQAQIRQAKLEWEVTIDALPQVVCLLDTRGNVMRANRSVERWGYGRVQDVRGRDLHTLIHPKCKDFDCVFSQFWCQAWEEVQCGRSAHSEIFDRDSQRCLSIQIHPLAPARADEYAGHSSFAAIIIQDITERKRAEEMLEAMSRRILEVQEAERRHIARELHDEIGQELTALKINLQTMQMAVHGDLPLLDECISIAEQALLQVRDLSLELRPSMLDDLGLIPTLRWYINRAARRGGFEADLSADLPDVRLSPEIETACFHITQAALNNVLRHARATRVHVWLDAIDDSLELTIQDDGIGFDFPAARERAVNGESLGLLSMEERAMLVGGRLEVKSSFGHGAQVRACFPGVFEKP